jgi:hypothetical protein
MINSWAFAGRFCTSSRLAESLQSRWWSLQAFVPVGRQAIPRLF